MGSPLEAAKAEYFAAVEAVLDAENTSRLTRAALLEAQAAQLRAVVDDDQAIRLLTRAKNRAGEALERVRLASVPPSGAELCDPNPRKPTLN